MSHGIKVITPATTLPISLDDVKLHLKIDTDTTEDSLLTALIYAAQEVVENYCRTRLFTTVEEYYLDQFPFEYQITLPKHPISAITYCQYIDTAGVTQTLDAANYLADTVSKPGRLCLQYAKFWPVTRWIDNAVWVRYSVGFGTTTATIPPVLKQAMLLIIGHYYQNKADVLINTHIEQLPDASLRLMNIHRYKRL